MLLPHDTNRAAAWVNPIVENAKKEPMVNPNQVFPPSSNEPALHIEIILNK